MGKWLEGINGRIAAVGAIAASVVALNGQLTSCSTHTITRHAAFRSAVTAEETYWRELFQQYAALASETNLEMRERKAFALAMLVRREIPKFNEYHAAVFEDETAISEAQDRFKLLQDTLKSALCQEEISGSRVAMLVCEQLRSEASDPAAQTTAQISALPAAQDVIVVPAAEPTYDTLVRARGSQGGWDVDVFWCVDSRDPTINRSNYERAMADANRLAAASNAGQPLAGVVLGRVRLRPLPELRQGAGLPNAGSGLSLRAEEKVGERNAANAVASLLNASRGDVEPSNVYRIDRSRASTNYYLSVFVCQRPQPVPGPPPTG